MINIPFFTAKEADPLQSSLPRISSSHLKPSPTTDTYAPQIENSDATVSSQEGHSTKDKETIDTTSEKICHMCRLQPPKYKCPGCLIRTCSLSCSKRHKEVIGCNGQRDKTHFVSMNDYNYSHMMNDYVFLEDVSRTVDTATRDNLQNSRAPRRGRQTPKYNAKTQQLLREARKRGVKLTLVAPGMKRRTVNCTGYSQKQKKIFWTVEWVFPECNNASVVDTGIPDSYTILPSLTRLFNQDRPEISNLKQQFDHFSHNQEFVLLLKKPFTPANKPAYYSLSDPRNTTWARWLRGKQVLEFPTVLVYTKTPSDLEIINEPEEKSVREGETEREQYGAEEPKETGNEEGEMVNRDNVMEEVELEMKAGDDKEQDAVIVDLDKVLAALNNDIGSAI
ncbi:uncharacterized protein VTP21DRAFT_423 [Calcarisporiella thermophila]|uniref:uncharacterized protein n=1 Tax=Calcarisporiella thermophila TaxID=911321 RepID=UPI0037425F7C